MKDTSRPHPTSSSRPAPYRKRKSSGTVTPSRRTRRAHDASQPQGHTRGLISPRLPDRANSSRRDEAQPSCTISSADDENRSLFRTGGNRTVSNNRRHMSMDGSARERPSHTSALSTYADVPGPFLRLPVASAPPTTTIFTAQRTANSPSPGSVTTFLRSIELADEPSTAPPLRTSFPITPPSLRRLPPLSVDNTNKTACTNGNGNGNGYQVTLTYKGYPFTYDLSALPEDPKGTIALLTITQSDPGAYLVVGAHYRRTGRSRAACAVIRSLLNNLDSPSNIEKGKGDAAPIPASETPTVTLVSPGSPCPKPTASDWMASGFKSAAMRPAMLLLAACELDISREHPDDLESVNHASAAHDLFRAVYGTVNDAIIAGAVRSQPKNALGLEFSSNRNCLSLSPSHPKCTSNPLPPPVELLARVKDLEKELSAARAAQKKLQDKLTASNDRLTRAEDKAHALESHSREMLAQLDAWRDENWELRQRLAESEQRARGLAQCAPSECRSLLLSSLHWHPSLLPPP